MGLLAGRPGQPRLMPFLAASLGLHLAVVVVGLVVASFGRPRLDLDDNVVKTKLVKLGKERDEKLLPRKEREKPPPPPPKPEAPKTVEPPPPPKPEAPKKAEPPKPEPPKAEPPKPDEPKPSARDILDRFTDKNEEKPKLTDLVRDTIDEGSQEGSQIGEEITGRLKATYNDRLLVTLKNALVVPETIDEKERLRLKARLYVAVGADGSLIDASITKSSGNDSFDNAVLAAAKKSAPFPAPPIQVRDFYASGVQMNVCPVSCR